jgi:hypothetical protein
MLDVLHQRFDRSAAIAIVPRNDVVHRVSFRFSSFGAHVLILLFQSRKNFPCHEKKARAPAPVNQSGIKSAICPCETSKRGFAMLPLSSSTVTAYAATPTWRDAMALAIFSADAAFEAGRISPGTTPPRLFLNCTTMIFSASAMLRTPRLFYKCS